MIRNLKVLGLALAAVFALSAVTASAASAQLGTLTSTGPVTLDGTQTGAFGSGSNALTTKFGATESKVECEKATYTGHKYNQTPHTFIPNDVTTFTVTPHYGTCVKVIPGLGTFPATIDMNGCDYVFHLEGTKSAANDEYFVSATVICAGANQITVTIFKNEAEHTAFKPFCHTTIKHKATDYTGLVARDTTTGDIDIFGTIEGIKVEKNTGILCPSDTDNNAKLHLDITVKGTNEAGGQTSIGISHL